MSFAGDIKKACDELDKQMSMVVRKVAFDALGGLVKLTPVDTGRARGNWRVVVGGSVPTGEIDRDRRGGSADPGETAKLKKWKPGKLIYLFNNVSYITALNQGSSKQNRSGIVSPVLTGISAALERGGTVTFTDVARRRT